MSLSRTSVVDCSDSTTANDNKTLHRFPEEDLLATEGFFITSPGTLLQGRYKVLRKLGRGRNFNTFLVEDLKSISHSQKYLAAKVLSVDSTRALNSGIIDELNILKAVAKELPGVLEPTLPVLRHYFQENGPHGVHCCFLTDPLSTHLHAFRTSAPTGKLAIHIVKPIISYVVEGLQALHARNIIHGGIRADNVFFPCIQTSEIDKVIAANPPAIQGTFELNGVLYPILRSQPFPPATSWKATPTESELIHVALGDLGSASWADQPKYSGDLSTFELRAPENIIRAECGKKTDIWAIGCLTYELLTGQVLFRSQSNPGEIADESLLLQQYVLTGETLHREIIEQSPFKTKWFDRSGVFLRWKSNIDTYPRQTVKDLLLQNCPELNMQQIDAAANFIGDCLRLNPCDRPDTDELDLHQWLLTAFMGGADGPEGEDQDPELRRMALYKALHQSSL